jgi:hypothetical protein
MTDSARARWLPPSRSPPMAVLTWSTSFAYRQVTSRTFALFRVPKVSVPAVQRDFCAEFDSGSSTEKGRRSGSCRGPTPVGGGSRRGRRCATSGWWCHWGGDNPSRTCDASKVSARAAKRPVPRRIPALSWRTSAHRATALSAFSPRRLPRRIAPAINPQRKPTRRKGDDVEVALVELDHVRADPQAGRLPRRPGLPPNGCAGAGV